MDGVRYWMDGWSSTFDMSRRSCFLDVVEGREVRPGTNISCLNVRQLAARLSGRMNSSDRRITSNVCKPAFLSEAKTADGIDHGDRVSGKSNVENRESGKTMGLSCPLNQHCRRLVRAIGDAVVCPSRGLQFQD